MARVLKYWQTEVIRANSPTDINNLILARLENGWDIRGTISSVWHDELRDLVWFVTMRKAVWKENDN